MALHSNRRKLRFFLQEHLGKINGYGDNMLDFYISKKTFKTFKGLNVHAFSECFDLILQKMFYQGDILTYLILDFCQCTKRKHSEL